MASGTYGIVRGADVSQEDIEVFYTYAASRDKQGTGLVKIANTSDVLIKVDSPNKSQSGINTFEMFGGMYTLKLPASIFSAKGIYTIVIKPVEIRTKIVDVGVLSAFPNIKGVLFDTATIPASFLNRFENNNLIGYRIEYLNITATDAKINNLFRVITSNNRAEPVNQNLTNSNQKAIRYRFNDNSTLVYCTVSPNSASNVQPNTFPFIGQPDQSVIITNTFFNPIMVEVEMVDYDVETLSYALFGNQSKSLEDGIYTIYNFSNQIYKQYDLYEIKDKFTGVPLFEIREQRSNIDFNKNFNTIITV
jgi:hypothetical protein